MDWQTQTASNAARGAEWTAAEIPDGAHAGGDGGGGVTTGPRLIGRCAGPGRGTSWLGKLLANESRRGREALDDEVWKLVLVGLSAQYLQASERASASEKVSERISDNGWMMLLLLLLLVLATTTAEGFNVNRRDLII